MAKLDRRRNGSGTAALSAPISSATTPSAAQTGEAFRCAVDGARLLAEGRPALAISMFERSIKLNPTSPASHNNLGVALLATGRLKQAIERFSAALRLDPSLASCHFQLAHIFDSLGHKDQALAAYQAGVALKPDIVAPQLRLGQLYFARGQRAELAAAFRAAALAAAGTIWAPIAEAGALHALGALNEALAVMRAAILSFPQSAEGHSNLGQLLGQAGHFSEAAAHHDRATQLSPEMAASWSGLATNKTFTVDDAPLIERMNAALARVNLTPRHRQALHFALGKAQDDIGDYENAIRNFEAGNRHRALSGRFNRRAFAQRIDQLIHETPPGYREHHPDRGVEDATPILIVGLPRSGSTLTEQILSSSSGYCSERRTGVLALESRLKQRFLEPRRFC